MNKLHTEETKDLQRGKSRLYIKKKNTVIWHRSRIIKHYHLDHAQVLKSLLNSTLISKSYFLNIEISSPNWCTHTAKRYISLSQALF